MTTPRMNITLKRIIVILLGCMFLLSLVSLAEDNQQGEQVNEQKKTPLIAEESFELKNTMRS